MARPAQHLFYEGTEQLPFPPEQKWVYEYDQNSRKVMEYLTCNGAKHTLCFTTLTCLEKLRSYLLANELHYTWDIAENWYEQTGPHPKGCLAALHRLQDFYIYGGVQPINAYPAVIPFYSLLGDFWKALLDSFLAEQSFKASYLKECRNCAARFLFYAQKNGVRHPSEISFEFLETYLSNDSHRSHNSKAHFTYIISDILLFMYSKGFCSCGIGLFPYFWMRGKIIQPDALNADQKVRMEAAREESQDFPSEDFAGLIPGFLERFRALGYSAAPCKSARYTLYNLQVFLEMYGLGYHPRIAYVWLEHEKDSDQKKGWKQERRILDLFELYTQEGDVFPQIFFSKKQLLCESLSDWAKAALNTFLLQKQKEGWAMSTLCMYRSSVTRFCRFLDENGMTSFEQLTPELIKKFNQTDSHQTAEGKNAYNVRIRKFLQFLERAGTLPYGICRSLYCGAAVHEKSVITLSEEEKKAIFSTDMSTAGSVELRNHAILLLGLRMGLRASDIVNLRLSDIDWNAHTINLIQQKTRHEIRLPMPVDVGNALYLYLKRGRHQTESQSFFIKSRTPYDSIKRGVCRDALNAALPERNCPGSGFHVTRKTFASDQLCNDVGKDPLADMLGHRGTSSLAPYLNLDPDKMRLCALSLEETGLIMSKGGRYDRI